MKESRAVSSSQILAYRFILDVIIFISTEAEVASKGSKLQMKDNLSGVRDIKSSAKYDVVGDVFCVTPTYAPNYTSNL